MSAAYASITVVSGIPISYTKADVYSVVAYVDVEDDQLKYRHVDDTPGWSHEREYT